MNAQRVRTPNDAERRGAAVARRVWGPSRTCSPHACRASCTRPDDLESISLRVSTAGLGYTHETPERAPICRPTTCYAPTIRGLEDRVIPAAIIHVHAEGDR